MSNTQEICLATQHFRIYQLRYLSNYYFTWYLFFTFLQKNSLETSSNDVQVHVIRLSGWKYSLPIGFKLYWIQFSEFWRVQWRAVIYRCRSILRLICIPHLRTKNLFDSERSEDWRSNWFFKNKFFPADYITNQKDIGIRNVSISFCNYLSGCTSSAVIASIPHCSNIWTQLFSEILT